MPEPQSLRGSRHENLRQLSAVLIRKSLFEDDEHVWSRTSAEVQGVMKAGLLQAVQTEPNDEICRMVRASALCFMCACAPHLSLGTPHRLPCTAAEARRRFRHNECNAVPDAVCTDRAPHARNPSRVVVHRCATRSARWVR